MLLILFNFDVCLQDDITIPDKDQEMNHSSEAVLNVKKLGDKEQLDAPQISAECRQQRGIFSEKISHEPLNLDEKCEGLTTKSALEVHSQVMHSVGGAECPLDNHLEKHVSPVADHLSASCASVAVEANNSKKCSDFIKGGGPIRLLQDYASDDDSEDGDQLLHEDINPLTALPSFVAGASIDRKDTGSGLDRDTGSMIQYCHRKEGKGSEQLSESSMLHKAADCSGNSRGEVENAGIAFMTSGRADGCLDNNPGNKSSATDATSHVDFRRKVILDGTDGHVISKRGKTEENEGTKAKCESASLKVDEFGRLVREGSSASDSDSGYTNRHERRRKRGRSRNRSRSPLDRRRMRSSRRRQEKRSRSRRYQHYVYVCPNWLISSCCLDFNFSYDPWNNFLDCVPACRLGSEEAEVVLQHIGVQVNSVVRN